MIICCDLDCVLNNLVHEWTAELNRRYNLNIYYENIKDYCLPKSFPSLTHSQIMEPLKSNGFWKRLKPYPGSQLWLKQLIKDGHDIYVTTATYYQNIPVKFDWLINYFPFLNLNNFICIQNKRMLNCDLMIDDWEENLILGRYQGVLLDAPWNRKFNEQEYGIVRKYCWSQIYNYISQYDTEQV